MVLYTDGVVEARSNGQRFGRRRLGSLLRSIAGPGDAVRRVGEAIDAFAETIQDDAAMLVLRREAEQTPVEEPEMETPTALAEDVE